MTRSLGRRDACFDWLRRYFDTVDPLRPGPEFRSVFLAIARGAFGGEGWELLLRRGKGWLGSVAGGFQDDPVADSLWDSFLSARARPLASGLFSRLRTASPSWPAIETTLMATTAPAGAGALYSAVAASESPPLTVADWHPLLKNLLAAYDDEEAPMHREHRLTFLTVGENGDAEKAAALLDQEWPLDGIQASLPRLLAEIAAGVETAEDPALFLALILGRPWLEAAHLRLSERVSSSNPGTIDIALGEWRGVTANGENESELLASFSRHDEENDKDSAKGRVVDEALIFAGAAVVIIVIFTMGTIIVPLLVLGGFWVFPLPEKRRF